ncbi:MAG: BolA/IbaG family iron-sulfur metabolism protein [Porticoccaceae bacterium]|nr:BolA/IbaG family iron-sulfur metabolism protein [Porticoccaceae bacterium]
MKIQTVIENKLRDGLVPVYMQVDNESHMHNVPDNAETHFKLVLVSDMFTGQRSVQRHRQVYQLLADELKAGVHALAMHTFSPQEWSEREQVPTSPHCLGGQ